MQRTRIQAFPVHPRSLPGPPFLKQPCPVSDKSTEVVIRGLTHEGKPFRPSDWAERLCGVMSAFGAEHRMEYSPYVQPINSGGVKCVVVSIALEELQPMAFNVLLNFAKDNELQVPHGFPPHQPSHGHLPKH